MPLTNTQLRYYDSNVLRFPADKRKEYHEQVDRLIAELSRSVRDKTEIKITRVVKAGSFAKFTILRKTRTDNLARIRRLLDVAATPEQPATDQTADAGPPQTPSCACPCCGGRMIIIETFDRGSTPQHRPSTPTIDTS